MPNDPVLNDPLPSAAETPSVRQLLLRVAITWLRIVLGMMILFTVFAIGVAIFDRDWRNHHLGGTTAREVTIAEIVPTTDRCDKYTTGRRAEIAWSDDDGQHTGWWHVCPGDGTVEVGDSRTLWVAPGRRAYDDPPWEILTGMPRAAVLAGTIITVIVLAQGRNREGLWKKIVAK